MSDLLISSPASKHAAAAAAAPLPPPLSPPIQSSSLPSLLCFKPVCPLHSRQPISSVSISPCGLIATAGSDGLIRLWSIDWFRDHFSSSTGHAQFAASDLLVQELSGHINPVTVVRFSPSGEYLASACDGPNPAIFIWKAKDSGDHSRTRSEWVRVSQFRGHSSDVTDLSWSPDSSRLASCSLDNSIRIWELQGERLTKTLLGHGGWVRGVAWDPRGDYVASQSDEGCLAIWSTSDWAVRRKIGECFDNKSHVKLASQSNHEIVFTRPSWAPDGSCLAAANGFSGSNIPVSPVFARGTWKRICIWAGHKYPTTVSRFNPRLFRCSQSSAGVFSLCAVASVDCSLTLWCSLSAKPVLHARHFFSRAIVDLAWDSEGEFLLAVSNDGTIAAFCFDFSRLQFPAHQPGSKVTRISGITKLSNEELKQKLSASGASGVSAKSAQPLPESVDFAVPSQMRKPLNHDQARSQPVRGPSQPQMPAQSQPPSHSVAVSQPPVVRRDGKRRIAPVNLENSVSAPAPAPQQAIEAPDAAKKAKLNPAAITQARALFPAASPLSRSEFVDLPDSVRVELSAAGRSSILAAKSPAGVALWSSMIPGRILLFSALGSSLILAFRDPSQLAVFVALDCSGRIVSPQIALRNAPAKCAVAKAEYPNYFAFLSTDAHVDVYRVVSHSPLLFSLSHSCSAAALLAGRSVRLAAFRLSDNGEPELALSNSQTFQYCRSIGSWICRFDSSVPALPPSGPLDSAFLARLTELEMQMAESATTGAVQLFGELVLDWAARLSRVCEPEHFAALSGCDGEGELSRLAKSKLAKLLSDLRLGPASIPVANRLQIAAQLLAELAQNHAIQKMTAEGIKALERWREIQANGRIEDKNNFSQ